MSGRTEEVSFSDEEWNSFFGATAGPADEQEADLDDLLFASDELTRVSRRISGQYAEIIASFAAQAFRGRASRDAADQAVAALDALMRLAAASNDTVQAGLLEELRDVIPPAADTRVNSRARDHALVTLRDWIPRFATTLSAEDAQRLLDLVTWDQANAPLMEELASIRGIGPKRLGRLYAAGLHTMEVVATADPIEVAQVTGLPQKLSSRVVVATQQFAVEERRRCLEQLRDRARRLREVLRSVQGAEDDEVRRLAGEAVREIELTFSQMTKETGS